MKNGYEHIVVERCDGVLFLTINRPHVRNALHPPAHRELSSAFDHFEADDRLNLAVISGAGDKAFCAGTDLKYRAETGDTFEPETGFAGLTERFGLTKPVIAAVNGDAIGGGLEIVMACDLAIAVRGARFGLPEPKVGLAAHGGLHRLIRQIPTKGAMEIALTARIFSAEEALGKGLINRLVESHELPRAVDELIAELQLGAPLALRATKQLMLDGLGKASLEAAFRASYPAYEAMLASDDAKEGPLAFSEKRKPNWRGR